MIKKIKKEQMGKSNLGWLQSQFHFSFAEYRNPDNINFGILRVLNDDLVQPKSGFDTHPHSNMEIVSYIVEGEITHKDSMGNEETLRRGEVQYISAGDGIFHSEHNHHDSKVLRLLQIWIVPPKLGLSRLYGSHRFRKDERTNKLSHLVSSEDGTAPIKLHSDVNFYASELEEGKSLEYLIKENRQLYFVQIEGDSLVNDVQVSPGDALEITDENQLNISALKPSHFLFIEMPRV